MPSVEVCILRLVICKSMSMQPDPFAQATPEGRRHIWASMPFTLCLMPIPHASRACCMAQHQSRSLRLDYAGPPPWSFGHLVRCSSLTITSVAADEFHAVDQGWSQSVSSISACSRLLLLGLSESLQLVLVIYHMAPASSQNLIAVTVCTRA